MWVGHVLCETEKYTQHVARSARGILYINIRTVKELRRVRVFGAVATIILGAVSAVVRILPFRGDPLVPVLRKEVGIGGA